jgi:hypothetical protein
MCFSMEWVRDLLIFLIVVGAVVAFVKLFLPYALSWMGWAGDLAMRAINIIVVAVVLCAIVYIFFALIGCLGGGSFPLFHR